MKLALLPLVLGLSLPAGLLALPAQECPAEFGTSGWVNDLGLLADAVSMGGADFKDDSKGVCGTYKVLKTCEARYQTRMRIYQSKADADVVVVSFRPTQQNPEGSAIHDNRQMVPCTFLNKGNCSGLVHQRFQEAFLELMDNCEGAVRQIEDKKHIFVTGHSLGGAMALFFTLHLWKDLGVLPTKTIGFAGPFIGDEQFSDTYQEPLKHFMGDNWWQVESVNKYNTGEFDGTVEVYNMNHDGPQIYIEQDAICGEYIQPLPVDYSQGGNPNFSYGMHDLKNYRLLTNKGQDCSAF